MTGEEQTTMYLATVTGPNGTTFYLGRKGWTSDRYHHDVVRFPTKGDAYRAYQKAFKRRDDKFKAEPAEMAACA